MLSTAPRDLTWSEIRDTLAGTRELVWGWLLSHGPATTTTIAANLHLNLLTVRPRVSELCAWGFAECVGREHREGSYKALTVAEAQARHDATHRDRQLCFKL